MNRRRVKISEGLKTFYCYAKFLAFIASDLICERAWKRGLKLSLQYSELEDESNTGESTATVRHWLPGLWNADEQELTELIPLVCRELRRLAESQLRREEPGYTLQATALADKAYVKLDGKRVPL